MNEEKEGTVYLSGYIVAAKPKMLVFTSTLQPVKQRPRELIREFFSFAEKELGIEAVKLLETFIDYLALDNPEDWPEELEKRLFLLPIKPTFSIRL